MKINWKWIENDLKINWRWFENKLKVDWRWFENKLKVIGEKLESENKILSSLRNLKEQKMWLDRKQDCELNKAKLEFLNQRI